MVKELNLAFRLVGGADDRAELGESPVWDPETGDLWWVDIDGRALFRYRADLGEVRRWPTPEIPGFVVLAGPEQPAIGMQTGIHAFDPETAGFECRVPFTGPGQRFNDAAVDCYGRLWAATMALDAERQRASIFRVTGRLALEPLVAGLTIPNGLAYDPQRDRLYYSDSHRDIQTIWRNSPAAGEADRAEAVIFATTTALRGRPDGAALGSDGSYWIAGVDGAELYVFDPDGTLRWTVPVPFPAPTKVAFFGAGGRSIAVTSKNQGENGGRLAISELPESLAPGLIQPFWKAGDRHG